LNKFHRYDIQKKKKRTVTNKKKIRDMERMLEKPEVLYGGPATHTMKGSLTARGWQFCPCGRDVCRAPDCPSHRENACGNDPLGR
jgi:hypothetical protein